MVETGGRKGQRVCYITKRKRYEEKGRETGKEKEKRGNRERKREREKESKGRE